MTNNAEHEQLGQVIERFISAARADLDYYWQEWPLDLSRTHVHEVVGGLLARQVSLAVNIASAPPIWNPNAAPVLLRAMTDVVISIGWILKDPDERSRQFILYGLGQLKLENERRKADMDGTDPDSTEQKIIERNEAWMSAQQYPFLTDVNLGSWSEMPTRKMAEEAGLLGFYNYAYQPFSAATHSMWHHIGKFNLQYCQSPLHRYHRVPYDEDIAPDPFWLYLAAKYLKRAFDVFQESLSISPQEPSAFTVLCDDLNGLDSHEHDSAPEPQKATSDTNTASNGEA